MSSKLHFPFARLLTAVLIFIGAGVVQAQHEPGGGTAFDSVGGSVTAATRSGHRSTRPTTPTPRRRAAATTRTKTVDADDYYEQGEKYYEAKQYTSAIEAYKKAI